MARFRLGRRLIRSLAALAALGVVAAAALFAFLWLEHRVPVMLPAPTGPFAVGRTSYDWVDPAHTDALAPTPGTAREVVAWIWYPADPAAAAAPAEYLPAIWRQAMAHYEGVLNSQFLTTDLARVRTHSLSDAAVAPQQRAYPVVILRAGLSALIVDYTSLAEDLASYGYVVVGFDAPYRTQVVVLPGGQVVTRTDANNPELLPAGQQDLLAARLVTAWTSDTVFVVDQLARLNAADPSGRFTGRLDLGALGMMGHSLGGATATQFCHDDPRCRAGIDIDGSLFGRVIDEGVPRPFMFILSDHGDLNSAANQPTFANMRSIYDHTPPDGRLIITIRGSNHFSFSDQALLRSQAVLWLLGRLGVWGGLDGRRGLAITADYVRRFFDVTLKGAPAALLPFNTPLYPEVQIVLP